jgi:nucleoside-diphosphate-sugar epimerase
MKWIIAFFACLEVINFVASLKVAVFGATGGVGQLVCSKLSEDRKNEVLAVSRNVEKLEKYRLLDNCRKVTLITNPIQEIVKGCDFAIISVGTTAFPTIAWKDNNNPKVACYDSVVNIMNGIEASGTLPKKILLLTSIGVERVTEFPFKILNSYGVLTEKKNSEIFLINECRRLGIKPIVCRPGRLIGAPFTNFDLAKLLQLENQEKRKIVISTEDDLKGDVDREDVSLSIYKILTQKTSNKNPIIYSIVNGDGPKSNDKEWEGALSILK